MMLDFFTQLRIKTNMQRNKREHSFLNYNRIKDVLILFNIDQWEEIKSIISILKKDGKHVNAWTIYSKEITDKKYPTNVKVIQAKEINWLNMLKPEVIDLFSKVKYDTLLDFNENGNCHLLSLLSQNKSKFCIGLEEREYRFYDFIFLKEKDLALDKSYLQLKKYLENIQ